MISLEYEANKRRGWIGWVLCAVFLFCLNCAAQTECNPLQTIQNANDTAGIHHQIQCWDPAAQKTTFPFLTTAGTAAIITNGLIAEYRMTDSGVTLTDSSGNGNNGTFPGGANNPTYIAGTGGLLFAGASAQFVTLPTAINAAQTVILVTKFVPQATNTWWAPILGDTNPCKGVFFSGFNTTDTIDQQFHTWTNTSGTELLYAILPYGTNVWNWELDNSADLLYFNNTLLPSALISGIHGSQPDAISGHYRLGGGNSTCPGGARNTNAFTGSIYYAAFYNREITSGEWSQNYAAIVSMLNNRGLQAPVPTPGPSDSVIFVGDSEGNNLGIANYVLNNSLTPFNIAVAGTTPENWLAGEPAIIPQTIPTAGGRSLILSWMGTNDQAGSALNTWQNIIGFHQKARQQTAAKQVVVSMMSRVSADPFKNSLNTLIRTNMVNNFDGFIDVGGDPNLGCDGCSANTTFLTGGLHYTTYAAFNIVGPMFARTINRLYGAHDFSTASVYASAAAAAVATTAGSESSNTVTITFAATPANCQVGNTIFLTGITPAGYNGTFQILTRSATQITVNNSNSGLGAITVQGTGVCPMQQSGDQYMVWNFGAGTGTLDTCDGWTGQNIYISNINAAGSTVAASTTPATSTTETITGSTTIAANTNATFQSVINSSALAQCHWLRIQ